MTEVLFQ